VENKKKGKKKEGKKTARWGGSGSESPVSLAQFVAGFRAKLEIPTGDEVAWHADNSAQGGWIGDVD